MGDCRRCQVSLQPPFVRRVVSLIPFARPRPPPGSCTTWTPPWTPTSTPTSPTPCSSSLPTSFPLFSPNSLSRSRCPFFGSSPLIATTPYLSIIPHAASDPIPPFTAKDLKPLAENSLDGLVANLKRSGADEEAEDLEEEADVTAWAANGTARKAWVNQKGNRKSVKITKEVNPRQTLRHVFYFPTPPLLLLPFALCVDSALTTFLSVSFDPRRTSSPSTSSKVSLTSTTCPSRFPPSASTSTCLSTGMGSKYHSNLFFLSPPLRVLPCSHLLLTSPC